MRLLLNWLIAGALAGAALTATAKDLVFGSIEENPAAEVAKFLPLANYTAERLKAQGITGGKVLVAKDMTEMVRYLREKRVDVYIDSPFPVLTVSQQIDSQIRLRRWKKGKAEYRSVILVHKDSGIDSPQALAGRTIAFEESYSTSGFFLPRAALTEAGLKLRQIADPAQVPPAGEVGYYFSGDEENSVAMLFRKQIDATALGLHEYQAMRPVERERFKVILETMSVPRQLVSLRAGLDPALADRICEILKAMESTEEGKQILQKFEKTVRFDEIPPDNQEALTRLKAMMKRDKSMPRP